MNKKVGVVTFYNYNYGSILQAFALYNNIVLKGFDCRIVDHMDLSKPWNKRRNKKNKIYRIWQCLKRPSAFKLALDKRKNSRNVIKCLEQADKFDAFFRTNFKTPDTDYTKDPSYFKFIAGSDQIWQLDSPGLHPFYFLRFCKQDQRVSYAASFSSTALSQYNKKTFAKFIRGFSCLSVREDVGLDLVRKELPSQKCTKVLDPVLLMPKRWWKAQIAQIEDLDSEPYILCYFLGDDSKFIEEVERIARELKAKIYVVMTDKSKDAHGWNAIFPGPLEFVRYVSNASYVCTDSLHGSEFSIVFNRQFTIFPRKYVVDSQQKSRLESLARYLGINSRFYLRPDYSPDDIINYAYIEKKLDEGRDISERFLNEALEVKK